MYVYVTYSSHDKDVGKHYTKQNGCFSPCHANCNELICYKTLYKPSQLNVISFLFQKTYLATCHELCNQDNPVGT